MAEKAAEYVSNLNRDIRALNSALLMMSQKIKALVRNEKILGRNILVLNKKIRDIQTQIAVHPEAPTIGAAGVPSEQFAGIQDELSSLKARLEKQASAVTEILNVFERLKNEVPSKEQLLELKYLVETINPLEFITFRQIDEIIDKKLKEKLGK